MALFEFQQMNSPGKGISLSLVNHRFVEIVKLLVYFASKFCYELQ